VAHAVVSLMHGLGYEVVAEGVETSHQIDVLRVIGCDAMQGHAIAMPMDETALRHWAIARMDGPSRMAEPESSRETAARTASSSSRST
jgi:EAL domain-containing protein (putative c-di-GMP-specific phosphodiesterase class I)